MANIYFHRFHAVTHQSRIRGRVMLTSPWYDSWKKQKCLQLCCKKLFPIIGLNVCKTCVLEVSPKSVWQLFHFFTSICVSTFKEILSKFLQFLMITMLSNQSKKRRSLWWHFAWDNKVDTLQTVSRPASNVYKNMQGLVTLSTSPCVETDERWS